MLTCVWLCILVANLAQAFDIRNGLEPDILSLLQTMNARILELERQNREVSKTLLEDRTNIAELQKSNLRLTEQHKNDLGKISELEAKINQICVERTSDPVFDSPETENKRAERSPAHVIGTGSLQPLSGSAFTATMTSYAYNLRANDIIQFDSIRYNLGGDFRHDYKFKCSLPGTYVFQATILAYKGHILQTVIVKDGNPIANMYAYGDTHYNTASALVVTHLSKDDSVWVKMHPSATGNVTGVVIRPEFSYFSGFRLY